MSNMSENVEHHCDVSDSGGVVTKVLHPKDRDLGGFSVRRLLPTVGEKMLGPWVFFDHMGPATFAAGTGVNVRPHPHIGIATVTYLFSGEILHRDSLGNTQPIQPGDINLMVAGRGIVHSERERPEITATNHPLHGLQLWFALPEEQEETAPAFYHYPGSQIPTTVIDGIPIRVMMGQAYGLISPVKLFSETLYLEAHLQSGQCLQLPQAEDLGVYVASGECRVGDAMLPAHSMAILHDQPQVEIVAQRESRIAMIGGKRLSPRFMEWNFVSSRKARIEQAKDDWRAGRFPKVIDDDVEFIPLP